MSSDIPQSPFLSPQWLSSLYTQRPYILTTNWSPIEDMRIVERVKQSVSRDGFSDLTVISQRFQIRRFGSDKWEELDLVIEHEDDYKISTSTRRRK